MSKQVSVSPERILAAAAKCATAKQTLEVLFPEVFEEEKLKLEKAREINLSFLANDEGNYKESVTTRERASKANLLSPMGNPAIQVRKIREYKDKGFWLLSNFHWEIKEDTSGEKVLVPSRK